MKKNRSYDKIMMGADWLSEEKTDHFARKFGKYEASFTNNQLLTLSEILEISGPSILIDFESVMNDFKQFYLSYKDSNFDSASLSRDEMAATWERTAELWIELQSLKYLPFLGLDEAVRRAYANREPGSKPQPQHYWTKLHEHQVVTSVQKFEQNLLEFIESLGKSIHILEKNDASSKGRIARIPEMNAIYYLLSIFIRYCRVLDPQDYLSGRFDKKSPSYQFREFVNVTFRYVDPGVGPADDWIYEVMSELSVIE